MKISYNWLRSYIPEIPDAEKLHDVLTYHLCEVESVETIPEVDTVFDLNILPNRAHDLLSHQGVARELSGQLGIPFVDPRPTEQSFGQATPKYKIPETKPTNLKIDIQSTNCRRYMGRIVKNIKVGPSPDWVVKHLESIGERSINNIVDATNIVMFDCGQPCHAFDADQIKDFRLEIRNAQEGETLELLGSEKIVAKLKDTDLIIGTRTSSAIADSVLTSAIAGVKGGTNSGISESTKDIILEVANFDPAAVRKTARRLGILSDAAKRFENDLSPELAPYAMKALSALVLEMCPEAQFEEIVDVYPPPAGGPQRERKILFTADFINKKLGTKITDDEIEKILKNYSFVYTRNGEVFEAIVPPLRLDLQIPEDMVEEIGRVHGYDKITPVLPQIDLPAQAGFKPKINPVRSREGSQRAPTSKGINETYSKILTVRAKLLADGYWEVMTYAFRDRGEVEVLASASDKKFLRTDLSDGLKESITLNNRNAPLFATNQIKLFEIGTVFSKNKEEIHVAFGDKKKVEEMTIDEFVSDNRLEVIDYRNNESLKSQISNLKSFTPWSLYPFITRDIAVWVPEDTKPDELISIFKKEGTDLLITEPRLFDTFKKPASVAGGDGKISYAFSLVFQSYDRTLTDVEINTIMEKITSEITDRNGWQVR